MIYVVFFAVCFLASMVGAICGIGGGVIIKPVLDSFGVLDVAAISFLSGCTVLSMATYSVIHNQLSGRSNVSLKTGFPLAFGAAAGGLLGKELFSFIKEASSDLNHVGAVQAICLLIATTGTLVYTIYKDKIKTCQVKNPAICILIGIFLGVLSSFLGIGGGPINLVVLFFFFSMTTKVAAENSLHIMFFSQIENILSSMITDSVPNFSFWGLVLVVIGGITGGVWGHAANKKMEIKTVDKFFMALMVVMILINIYNVIKFMCF